MRTPWHFRLALWLSVLVSTAWAQTKPGQIQFNRDVRPILSDTCFKCHGFDKNKRKADLRLDVRDEAIRSRDTGEKRAPVVPGNPEQSNVWRRIIADDPDVLMPPPDSHLVLTEQQKETLRLWIAQGAVYEPHWSFVPVMPATPPQVTGQSWTRNEIDLFVLARLKAEGLEPSPEADKSSLVRRVTLDLTGLPPTLTEVDVFLNDAAPDAYERLVDRLLASPRYGERMALDWLDAARYADTHGFNNDSARSMWPWRDWVIQSFNANKPYNVFLTEQLAGDLLPNATLDQKIASAFNRNHVMNSEGGIIDEEYRVEYVVDRTTTVGTVFMGLTLQCARCHDHKFDPITQKEFYQLFGFFNSLDEKGQTSATADSDPLLRVPTEAQQRELASVEAELSSLKHEQYFRVALAEWSRYEWEPQLEQAIADDVRLYAPELTPGEIASVVRADPLAQILALAPWDRTTAQQQRLRDQYLRTADARYQAVQASIQAATKHEADLNAAMPTVMVMKEMSPPRPTFVLRRGAYDARGDSVAPDVPAILPPLPKDAPHNRLGLAMWLTDPRHPLTSRVAVNRIWYQLFGTGLVKTLEDWGVQGEPPSHPELLDWLADHFVRGGWDVKALQRLIVTSATYRQAARCTPELIERDPENRLLARGSRFRLAAEAIRDNALALSGLLVDKLGGPSVMPYQPAGLWEDVVVGADYPGTKYVQGHGDDLYRRSMYTFWKRTAPPPALNTFDAPEREFCQVRRPQTNTPLQALVLLNDPTYAEASRKLAERVMHDGGATPTERLNFVFRLATAREPEPAELRVLAKAFDKRLLYYQSHPNDAGKLLSIGESPRDVRLDAAELAAYATVASMVLNLDEVITR